MNHIYSTEMKAPPLYWNWSTDAGILLIFIPILL